ncbi:MAG TPA: hypothetical protein VFE62_05075 [Gemmataceae bacterium]|nr:hypothetical protein [Gemmataceae bacterium]
MKRLLACLFVLGLIGFAGCFTAAPPKVLEHDEPTALVETRETEPVTSQKVNPENASEKLQELADELDRAERRLTLKTPH